MGGMDITTDQLKALAERAVKTFAQAFVAYVLAGEATSLYEVDWATGFGVAGLALVLSLLTSLGSWNVGEPGPSLGAEVPKDEYIKVYNKAFELDAHQELDRLASEERGD